MKTYNGGYFLTFRRSEVNDNDTCIIVSSDTIFLTISAIEDGKTQAFSIL